MLQVIDRESNVGVTDQISKMLQQHIVLLSPGSRIPNEVDLCKRFGVSRMTVSKAINKLVNEGRLYRIRSKGTFVKKPIHKVKSIKVLLPGPGSLDPSCRETEVFRHCMHGVSHEAHKLGIRVETVLCTHDHRQESMNPGQFRGLRSDTNVFVPSQWWHPLFEALSESNCNVVMCNNQEAVATYEKYMHNWYLLTLDRIGATEEAVNYLVNQGRKRIFAFSVYDPHGCNDPRWQGYLNGLSNNHIEFDPELSMEVKLFTKESLDFKQIFQTLKRIFLKKHFDALIIPNMWFINVVFELIKELDLRVPEDLALISIGDSPEIIEAPVPISAMSLPVHKLGEEAVKIFNRDIFVSGEKVFKFDLIERESSCKGAGAVQNPGLQPQINYVNPNISLL